MAGEIPSGFGGLLRYKEEYDSKFKLNPGHVISYVMALVLFVILLRIFFPAG